MGCDRRRWIATERSSGDAAGQVSIPGDRVARFRLVRRRPRKLGIPRSYGSYEELLADPGVKAIYNPLQRGACAVDALALRQASIFCTRSRSRLMSKARQLLDARASQQTGAEASPLRFHPQWRRARARGTGGSSTGYPDLLLLPAARPRQRAQIGLKAAAGYDALALRHPDRALHFRRGADGVVATIDWDRGSDRPTGERCSVPRQAPLTFSVGAVAAHQRR
jgi:hypothetical protein